MNANIEKYYLGIDLGTSSAKAILKSKDGNSFKAKAVYLGDEPSSWMEAVKALISELNGNIDGKIAAISLSSQVGTYIVNNKEVISWRSSVGRQELDRILSSVTEEEFIDEIGMRHPDLISYPLPRLLYIQEKYGPDVTVMMPKDLLIHALTGEYVTDVFTMRGIAHPEKVTYAEGIMKRLGITLALPTLKKPASLAGYVSEGAEKIFGLDAGTPVYLGCNDFYAGLLGMGVTKIGDVFDLSGTSEHIGYVTESLEPHGFVSGGYFEGFATYGGTKSSGSSCDLAIKNFGIDSIDPEDILSKKPPIFLPYLSGERAPIFDENARGVYFGLNTETDSKALSYSTLEGVVFSLYHIGKSMNMPKTRRLICGGGSAKDPVMNLLRASIFDCETVSVKENDTSALGACMIAMIGDGVYPDISIAADNCVEYSEPTKPHKGIGDLLRERFKIYEDLYASLKNTFEKFSNI